MTNHFALMKSSSTLVRELKLLLRPHSKCGMNYIIQLLENESISNQRRLLLLNKHPRANRRHEPLRENPNRYNKIDFEIELWNTFWNQAFDAAIKDSLSDEELLQLAKTLCERSKVLLHADLLPYYPKREVSSESDDEYDNKNYGHGGAPDGQVKEKRRRRDYIADDGLIWGPSHIYHKDHHAVKFVNAIMYPNGRGVLEDAPTTSVDNPNEAGLCCSLIKKRKCENEV